MLNCEKHCWLVLLSRLSSLIITAVSLCFTFAISRHAHGWRSDDHTDCDAFVHFTPCVTGERRYIPQYRYGATPNASCCSRIACLKSHA